MRAFRDGRSDRRHQIKGGMRDGGRVDKRFCFFGLAKGGCARARERERGAGGRENEGYNWREVSWAFLIDIFRK